MAEVTQEANEFFLIDSDGKKKIGEIYGDRLVVHKTDEHYYVNGQGFCINKELVQEHLDPNTTVVVVYHGKRGEKVFKDKAKNILMFPTIHEVEDEQILIREEKFRGDSDD